MPSAYVCSACTSASSSFPSSKSIDVCMRPAYQRCDGCRSSAAVDRVVLEGRTHQVRGSGREDALEPVEASCGDVLLVARLCRQARSPAPRAPASRTRRAAPRWPSRARSSAYADVAGSPIRSAIATASALSSSRGRMSQSSRRAPASRARTPHPQRAVSWRERRKRLVQQRDDLRVGAGAHPHEPTAVADRRTRELLGVGRLAARGRRHRGTSPSRRRCRRHGSAASPSVEEQLDPFGVIRRARQRSERHLRRDGRPPRTRAAARPARQQAARRSPRDRPGRRGGSRSNVARARRAESRCRVRAAPRVRVRLRRGADGGAARGSPGTAIRT